MPDFSECFENQMPQGAKAEPRVQGGGTRRPPLGRTQAWIGPPVSRGQPRRARLSGRTRAPPVTRGIARVDGGGEKVDLTLAALLARGLDVV